MPADEQKIQQHDYFNIFSLFTVCFLDFNYLFHATDFSKLGTNEIGSGHGFLFTLLFVGFAVYLVADMIWIYMIPDSVPSDPMSILIHHLVTLVFISFPLYAEHYAWHMAITLSVEINTLFLLLRRNSSIGSLFNKIAEALFYTTWVLMRLIMFPVLAVFFAYEYERRSKEIGSYYNVVIAAPTLQLILTAMSYKWTYDMLVKITKRKQTHNE